MPKVVVWKIETAKTRPYRQEEVQFVPPPDSLNAASRQIPDGVYTTLRTFEGVKVLSLEEHIQRLEESARLLDTPISIDRQGLKEGLHRAIHRFNVQDARIRITVDLEEKPGTIYLTLEPLQMPTAEDYAQGVWVVTCPYRRENPQSKQTAFLSIAEAIRRELPAKAFEGLLLDENGQILEGMTSNFFAVKDGELWTARDSMLPGITRSLILEAAREEGIPVRLESTGVGEIGGLQEAFLTSSSRSVLPIRKIDDWVIGQGEPGPITRRLAQVYWQSIQSRFVQI